MKKLPSTANTTKGTAPPPSAVMTVEGLPVIYRVKDLFA